MDSKRLGYVIQFAGLVALAVAAFYGAGWIRACVVGGAAALVAGRWLCANAAGSGKSEG